MIIQGKSQFTVHIDKVEKLFLHCGPVQPCIPACVQFATVRAILPGRYTVEGEKIMVELKEGPATPEAPNGTLDSVEFQLNILNVLGKQAKVDGPIVQTTTGEASIELFFDEANRKGKIKRAAEGAGTIVYSGDANLNPGADEVRPFEIVIAFNCPGSEAVTFEAVLGPVVAEPIA